MSFLPTIRELIEAERAVLVRQQEKRTHFSIVEIGDKAAFDEWKKHQVLIDASKRIISEAKALQTRAIAIRMVEEQISELKLDPTEKALTQDRKRTKFDALVTSLRAVRKRHFQRDEQSK